MVSCPDFDLIFNEEQIIHGYPIDGGTYSSGGSGSYRVCLHNNARHPGYSIDARLHCGPPDRTPSTIYTVSSVGTSLKFNLTISS